MEPFMIAVLAAWPYKRVTHFDVWGVLFWLNIIALVVIAIALLTTIFRHKREEKAAANAVAFLDDEQLEGPRLERVLGWALFFFAVFAITMPLYWLRETTRQEASVKYFSQNAINRGETLFSNEAMPDTFDPAKSLKCANCHGVAGAGGSGANYVYKDANGKAYTTVWRAPALNTVLYRFSPQEVHDIITYGRAGTPMQAWGVLGGGPKNDQSVNDLVAYITSIQLPPGTYAQATQDLATCAKGGQAKTALGQSSCALVAARTEPATQVADARTSLAAAQKSLADDQNAYATADHDPSTPGVQACADATVPAEAKLACRNLQRKIQPYTDVTGNEVQGDDVVAVANAEQALNWALEWQARRKGVTDGQLLFETNCARCHTKNWSIFDPTNPDLKPEDLLGPPGGGGSMGFNLRGGQEARRFPATPDANGNPQPFSGLLSQIAFVVNGADANKGYGVGGIGTAAGGGMPGQCNTGLKTDTTIHLPFYGCMLSSTTDGSDLSIRENVQEQSSGPIDRAMIDQIVAYERCGMDETTSDLAPPSFSYENCR
jgi:mono/diheme cytochrome c family protein